MVKAEVKLRGRRESIIMDELLEIKVHNPKTHCKIKSITRHWDDIIINPKYQYTFISEETTVKTLGSRIYNIIFTYNI